jgi:hypothetical protein
MHRPVRGQRQVTQFVREGPGLSLLGRVDPRVAVRSVAQQPGGFGCVEDVDADRVDARVPAARAAAGDQLVTAAQETAEVGREVDRVLSVVEDEQPPVVRPQPGQRPFDLLARRGGQGPGRVEMESEVG